MTHSSSSILIRAFEHSDAPAFTQLLNLPGVIDGTLQFPFRSVTERTKTLQYFQPQVNLVAEADGMLVGHACLGVSAEPRCRHTGTVDLVVHDDHRRRGIGQRLMSELLTQADNWLGLRRVELTVLQDNHPAIALYEKFGFQREGLFHDYAFKAGHYVNAIPMARIAPK